MEENLEAEVHLTVLREALAERRHRVGVELATLAFFSAAIAGIFAAFVNKQRPAPDSVSQMVLTALTIGFGYGTIVRIRLSSRAFDRVTRLHDGAANWLRERSRLDLPATIGRSSPSGRGTAHGYVIAVVLAVVYLIWASRLQELFCAEVIAILVLVLAHFLPQLPVNHARTRNEPRQDTPPVGS